MMGNNRKPRKAYKPRAQSLTGGIAVLADRRYQAIPLPDDNRVNVCAAYLQSINAMISGRANQKNFDTITYAINIGLILAENGMGEDHIELMRNAANGMQRTKERYLATGAMGFDGDALAAVRAAYDLHEEQMRIANHGELGAALKEMHRRLAA